MMMMMMMGLTITTTTKTTMITTTTTTIFLFYLDSLGSLACAHSELILKCESYRESAGLLGRGNSPVGRPIPTQDNTNGTILEWDSNQRPQYSSR
jgi:hypothetical protein